METIQVSSSVVQVLKPLSEEEQKRHVLTEDGLTLAEIEELDSMLDDPPENFTKAMTPDEYRVYIAERIRKNKGE